VTALVQVLAELSRQIETIEGELSVHFDRHPDVEIYRSQPGLGTVLAARALAEFGDDPHRYLDAKARRNYAATSPITRASGTRRVMLARYTANKRLRDALYLQAFAALNRSPGARADYERSPRPRRHPSSGAACTGQPPRQHPPRPPTPPSPLRRSHCMASISAKGDSGLTVRAVGCLNRTPLRLCPTLDRWLSRYAR
jgi:Transposase IS116/IS110/IS902 family